MRLFIWIALLAIVLAGRWWWRAAITTALNVQIPGGWFERQASPEEWSLDIEELGRSGYGKRLVWLPIQRDVTTARGILVWWHDGLSERLGYVSAEGEDGARAVLSLVSGLMRGEVVLYDAHGDPGLLQRIVNEMDPNWALPAELKILRLPDAPL